MIILNPDQYLLPDYKISPFQTQDIYRNSQLPEDNSIDAYFEKRFAGRNFGYTINGRSALHKALSHYRLQPEDVVTILTTSGNFYISSCVTGEVEKFCLWNREVTVATKVIIVVHEFGYPYGKLTELKRLGIPIIEDCAYAFFSEDEDHTIGTVGEFSVYSFPKMFPLQVGGLLTFRDKEIPDEQWPQSGMKEYIQKVLSAEIQKQDSIIQRRLSNYQWLQQALSEMGFRDRLVLRSGMVPGVYMFRADDSSINLPTLKEFLFQHGIQCSVFYGEQSFFIPNHQALDESDLRYFVFVIQSFLNTHCHAKLTEG